MIRDSDIRRRLDRGETIRAANTLDSTVAYRLGRTWNYGYGESRPELRPIVEDE